MIKSLHGMALRFFKENKLIAMTSIIGVVFSISLIITISLFMSNAKESLLLETQKMFGEMDLAVGYNPGQEKAISLEQAENVVEKYPLVDTLIRLVCCFKEVLQSGDKELLHTWISDAAALELN